MKKLLCYLGIIILLALILFPPMLRILLPDQEEVKEDVKIERIVLSCSNDEYITNTSYDNDKVNMIIIKKIDKMIEDDEIEDEDTLDEAQESLTGDELVKIFEELKDKSDVLYNKVDDGEVISIDYTLSEHPNLEITELINTPELQQEFYEEQNLACVIRK